MGEISRRAIALFKTQHNTFEIPVEVAETPGMIAAGLSFRHALFDNVGMYFKFDEPTNRSFWMQNTFVPLSIAFIDSNHRIIDIQDMEPNSLNAHAPKSNYVGAFEIEQGWFEDNDVQVGDYLELRDTNHPLTLGEEVDYGQYTATADHKGLNFHGESYHIPWEEVDHSRISHTYPRYLNSTEGNLRNSGGFKAVSFVQIDPKFLVTGAGTKSAPKSKKPSVKVPTEKPVKAKPKKIKKITGPIPEMPEGWIGQGTPESWATMMGKFQDKGIDPNKYVDRVSGTLKDIVEGNASGVHHLTPDQQSRSRSFIYQAMQHPIHLLTTDFGIPGEQASATTAILSTGTRFDSGNGAHMGNVAATLHHAALMHRMATEGYKITESDARRISGSKGPVEMALRAKGVTESVQEFKPGDTVYIDEINDATLSAMSPHAQMPHDKYKSFRMLRSVLQRGPNIRPLSINDVQRTQVKTGEDYEGFASGPKVASFAHNGQHPLTSWVTVHDQIMNRMLGSHLTSAEFAKFQGTSDAGRGKPPVGLPRDAYHFGKGAAYLAQHLLFLKGVADSGIPFDAPHEAQNLLWPYIKMNAGAFPISDKDKTDKDSSDAALATMARQTKEALDSDPHEIYSPYKDHKRTELCDIMHPLEERAAELSRSRPTTTTRSGLVIPDLSDTLVAGLTRNEADTRTLRRITSPGVEVPYERQEFTTVINNELRRQQNEGMS